LIQTCGIQLMKACGAVHEGIVKGTESVWAAGTAALLGGVLLEVKPNEEVDNCKWCFVCISVGNCKVIVFCVLNFST